MTELAVVDSAAPAVLSPGIDVARWAETLVFAAQLAEKVHDTEFVPKALRGRPEAVAATIMYGAEVGVTPMQALAGIHIVEGRPAPSAELMRAMILRAGHTFTVHELSGTRARVSGLRRGEPESERFVIEWTADQARAAGLMNRPNWRNYPRAMLLARATGDLARAKFPDVVKGLGYVAETADSVETLDGWHVPDPPVPPAESTPRKALQRRRRAKTAQPPNDEPVEPSRGDSEPPEAPVAEPEAAQVDAGGAARRPGPERQRYADDDGPLPDEMQPTGTGQPIRPTNVVPLPDLEPEQPPPDEPPPVGPKMIGPGQQRAVQAMLTAELGTVATTEERHALLSAILGRDVDSAKTLTRDEAFRVLDMGSRFADGSARFEFDLSTGAITVHDTREPPPDEQRDE